MNLQDAAAISQISGTIANTAINGISYIDSKKARRESMAWNEKMYDRQLQDNRENWNMQNAYNSPAAQMERLKAADLNPHLVYGNGGNTGNNASNIATTNSHPYSPYQLPQNIVPDMGSIMDATMKLEQLKNVKAERENLVSRTRLTNLDGDLRALQKISQAMDNTKSDTELRYLDEMLKSQLTQTLSHIRNTDAQTDSVKEAMRGNKLKNDVYERYGEKLASYDLKNSAMDLTVKSANVSLARANTRLAIANAVDTEFMNRTDMQRYRKQQLINSINNVYWDIQNSKKAVSLKEFQDYCNKEFKRTGLRINDNGSFGLLERSAYSTGNFLERLYHKLF